MAWIGDIKGTCREVLWIFVHLMRILVIFRTEQPIRMISIPDNCMNSMKLSILFQSFSSRSYIYNANFKCVTSNIWIKKQTQFIKSTNISLLFKSFLNVESNYKQTRIQITQQYNKSKLKTTYRIKKVIFKGKM